MGEAGEIQPIYTEYKMLFDEAYWATEEELLAEDAGWDAGYRCEVPTPTTNMVGYRAGRQAYLDDMPVEPNYQDLENAAWDAGFSGEGTINRVGYWLGVMAYHTDMGREPCLPAIRAEIGAEIRKLFTPSTSA